jgi:hypothetical protein
MNDSSKSPTCKRCGISGLTWAKSVKGNWYLGVPYIHTFEDGNQVMTHVVAHNCNPTEEQQAKFEAERAEVLVARAQEQAELDARIAEANRAFHIPAEIGEKVTITGTVIMATDIETGFGTSRLIVVKTPEAYIGKMMTTAEWAWNVDFEEEVTVTAVIKSHDTYQGKAQTTLLRPKRHAE